MDIEDFTVIRLLFLYFVLHAREDLMMIGRFLPSLIGLICYCDRGNLWKLGLSLHSIEKINSLLSIVKKNIFFSKIDYW